MGLIIKTIELSGATSGDPADVGHALAREACIATAREVPAPALAKFAAGIISGVGALAAVMGNHGAADLLEGAAKALRELPPPAAGRH